jgi:conjugal transfer/entry exclusion protein
MEEIRIQLTTQIDHLQDQLAFNHAAAQNGQPLKGAQNSLERLQALTADAQRLAADLDSFGGTPVVPGKPVDEGKAVEATKRR